MAVYKEVDELLKAMDTWDKFGLDGYLFRLDKENEKDFVAYVRYEDMVQAVTGTPRADVAPVVHAHWIENEDCSVVTDIPWSMCAACGSYSPKLLYCAFCGAKMDEVV